MGMNPISNTPANRQPAGVPVGGQFAAHNRAEGDTSLDVTLPDPWESMRPFPAKRIHLFAEASTFAEVDSLFLKHEKSQRDILEEFDLRWSAIERCREIRKAGAAGTPTALETEGWHSNEFAAAQNYVELAELFSQCTEEPPGDGEFSAARVRAWRNDIAERARGRLVELQAAGVISRSVRIS